MSKKQNRKGIQKPAQIAFSANSTRRIPGVSSPAVLQTVADNPSTEKSFGFNFDGAKPVTDKRLRTLPSSVLAMIQAASQSGKQTVASNIVAGPASVVELSRALDVGGTGPQNMFEWVYTNVDWEPGWGVYKGALGAITDGVGNSFDQSLLLANLLREAGYTANIVMGAIRLTEDQYNAWFGTDSIWAARNYCFNLFVPVVTEPTWTGTEWYMDIKHVWVEWVDSVTSTTYVFDPSLKSYTRKSIRTDIDTILGYSGTSFMSDAQSGATVTTDYVQNINRTNIRSNLSDYAGNLVDWIRTNDPDAQVDDLLGGQTIDPANLTLQTALPYQMPGDMPTTWSGDVPNTFKPTIQIQFPNWNTPNVWDIDWMTTSDDLACSRLTLFYDGMLVPSLAKNGSVVATGLAQPSGTWTSIFLTVTHPAYDATNYPNVSQQWYQTTFQWWQSAIYAGNSYLIGNAWGNMGRGQMDFHQEELSKNQAAGGASTSEPVLGEKLAMTFYRWTGQNSRVGDLVNRMTNCKSVLSHQVGIIGYHDTVTGEVNIDLGGVSGSSSNLNNDVTKTPINDTVVAMHGVALEAATLAQVTGSGDGVSTTTVIDAASVAGAKLYKGTSANWNTGSNIESDLITAGYSSGDMNDLYNWYIQWGYDVMLGDDPSVSIGSWSGWGYWAFPIAGAFGIINGGFKGGTTEGDPDKDDKKNDDDDDKDIDPIGIRAGTYLLDSEDLTVGSQPYPYSVSFGRSYNSRRQYQSGVLGRGWRHTHDITATVSSNGFYAMGHEYAEPASATIAELFVCCDIIADTSRPVAKLAAMTLADAWWIERMFNNSVVVSKPSENLIFIKQPDGTYSRPQKFAATLTEAGGLYTLSSPQGVQTNFNSAGQVDTIVYPNGVTITYTYSSGLLSTISNGLGRTLTLSYSSGKLTAVSDGNGRSVSFTIDGNDDHIVFTDANGEDTAYQYDQPGRMTEYFYPAFPTTAFVTNEYDSLSRVKTQENARGQKSELFIAGSRTTVVEPLGNSRTTYFNQFGSKVKEIDGLGIVTEFVYDGLNRLIETIYPEGNKVVTTFDENDNRLTITMVAKPGSGLSDIVRSFTYDSTWAKVATETDGNGNTTSYSYDNSTGDLLTIERPLIGGVHPTVTMTYNGRGQMLTREDETGIVTEFTYDSGTEKLLTRIIDSGLGQLNLTTTYGHDSVGNVTSVEDARGNTTSYQYDALRQVTQRSVPTPFGFVTNYTYNENGKLTQVNRQTGGSPPWQTRSWTYSAGNEKLTETDPASNTTTWTFDGNDRKGTMTDAESRLWQYGYDDNNRMNEVTDPTSTVSDARTFTANGKLETVEDALGNVTQYSYDGHDRLERTTFDDTSYEENTLFDENGNVLTYTTRSGNTIVSTFDVLNRMTTRSPQGQPTVSAHYDLAGRLTELSKPLVVGDPSSGALEFHFDSAGRFYKEVYPDGKVVEHERDENGNVTKTTYPDGYYVERVYDELNRLTDVKLNGSGTSAVAFTYNDLSQRTQMSFSNGATVDYAPELNEDLSQIVHNFIGSSATFDYSYNNVHEVTSQQVSDATFMWHPGAASSISYGTADGVNKYPSVGAASFTYDSNANLTGDSAWTWGYDTENHLVSASNFGVTANMVYDPLHRQSQKESNSVKTRYVYAGWQRIADYDGTSGALQNRYVYGANLDEPLISVSAGGVLTFLHADKLGSIVATSNNSGVVTNKNAYGPFGEISSLGGTTFGYTGQRYDADLGLHYFKFRYLVSELGRFAQPDPVGYDSGLNLYTYVSNSPMNNIDPMGLQECDSGLIPIFDDEGNVIGLYDPNKGVMLDPRTGQPMTTGPNNETGGPLPGSSQTGGDPVAGPPNPAGDTGGPAPGSSQTGSDPVAGPPNPAGNTGGPAPGSSGTNAPQ